MFRKEFLARCTIAANRPVSGDMLEYCQRKGYVDRPPKRGGQGWYDESHIEQMLDHLEQRGRYVSREVDDLVAQAAEVGKPLRKGSDMEAANDE